MKANGQRPGCSRDGYTVRKLRVSALLLFLGMASLADDRLIIEAKVNGKPVRLMFDTGAEASCLFRKSAQRLGISFTEPRHGQSQIQNGRVSVGRTEEFCLSFGDAEQKALFGLIDNPPYLEVGADGLIAWSDVTNDILLISADDMQVSVLDTLPTNIGEWSKWRLRSDSRCLAIEVPIAGEERKYVYIDTGMGGGVELGDKQWKRWRSENPKAPVTMRAYYTPADGVRVSEQCWARRFSVGEFFIPDAPIGPSSPGLAYVMKEHAAILGLFALTRFHVILDKKNSFVYMKPNAKAKSEFQYNKAGVAFAPTITNCDDLVAHVVAETPAYETGIRNGDILLKIDDLDVTKWRTDPNVLPLSRFFARSAGTQLQLVLEKDGKQCAVKLILKDLFGPPFVPPCDSAHSRLLEYRAEAERGDAQAQYLLGVCYHEGNGVATNVVEAVKWYRKAAEQNLAPAQSTLGVCYATGKGVVKDDAEAVKWYRKAAEQNYAEAQSNLGACYLNGQGVAKDEVEAVKWFRKAAEQNLVQAQNNLGVCYVEGLGVEKDNVEAYKWWLLADAQGEISVKQNMTRLERQLTQEQQAEGRRRAGNLKPPEAFFRGAPRGEAFGPSVKHADSVMAAEQALAKAERNLAPDHPEVAVCLCRLGEAYAAQGQHALAASIFRRALSVREKALGPDRAEVAEVLEKLAAAYRKIGSWEKESDDLEKRAAAIRNGKQ